MYGTGGRVYHSPEVEELAHQLLYGENLELHLSRLQQTPRPNYLEPRDEFSDPMFAKKFEVVKKVSKKQFFGLRDKTVAQRIKNVDEDYEVIQDESNIPGLEGHTERDTTRAESVLHYEQVVEQREEQCGIVLEAGPLQQGQD